MKKIINFLLLFFPIMLLAQSETTLDEYKYLTKGYAYQKEMGLDGGKEGYEVKPLYSASNGIEFRGLLKDGTTVKGVLVIMNGNSGAPTYLCLPTNSASNELKGLAASDAREKLNLNDKVKFDKAILEFAMFQLDGSVASSYANQTERNSGLNNVIPKEEKVEEYSTVVPLKVVKTEKMTERSGTTKTDDLPINNNVLADHNFSERSYIQAPVVKGQNPKSGTVVVKMCIDIEGNVKWLNLLKEVLRLLIRL